MDLLTYNVSGVNTIDIGVNRNLRERALAFGIEFSQLNNSLVKVIDLRSKLSHLLFTVMDNHLTHELTSILKDTESNLTDDQINLVVEDYNTSMPNHRHISFTLLNRFLDREGF